jgi:hypothetical protein
MGGSKSAIKHEPTEEDREVELTATKGLMDDDDDDEEDCEMDLADVSLDESPLDPDAF